MYPSCCLVCDDRRWGFQTIAAVEWAAEAVVLDMMAWSNLVQYKAKVDQNRDIPRYH